MRGRKHRSSGRSTARRGRDPRSDGDVTRAQIQRALLRLIAREGTAGVTHRSAAREAGVSLSATTYYFESKQDMIRSAFELLAADLRSQLGDLVAAYGGEEPGTSTPEQETRAFGVFARQQLAAPEGEILTTLELLMTMARDAEARERLGEERSRLRQLLVELLHRSHARQPEEDADLLMSLVAGLLLESLVRGRPCEFEERAARIAERAMGWVVRGE